MNSETFSYQAAPPANRDVVIYPKDTLPQRISYMSCNLDPMCYYPLLFPRGDLGWYDTMQHVEEHWTATRTRVTMQQFHCYRLEEFSPIHSGGKLFQQYAVVAYVKTEGCRLYYICNNQAKLRVELYSGLMDHLQNTAIERNIRIGTPVVLPSSFAGSPRAMQQNYQYAMAIVVKYGKSDLFLTYTCNPKAREITENLRDGQKSEYRPDLVSRVFKLHLAELLNDIKNRHVLGVPIAHVHVIEFQKRGLPHCHMLITLAAKRRQKGMVIILCVCVSVCVSVRKKLGKLQTLTAQTSYWQTSNYTRMKNNNRLLLKPFGYKVMTIYITHGFCFQT